MSLVSSPRKSRKKERTEPSPETINAVISWLQDQAASNSDYPEFKYSRGQAQVSNRQLVASWRFIAGFGDRYTNTYHNVSTLFLNSSLGFSCYQNMLITKGMIETALIISASKRQMAVRNIKIINNIYKKNDTAMMGLLQREDDVGGEGDQGDDDGALGTVELTKRLLDWEKAN
jgi:hypothetical protein